MFPFPGTGRTPAVALVVAFLLCGIAVLMPAGCGALSALFGQGDKPQAAGPPATAAADPHAASAAASAPANAAPVAPAQAAASLPPEAMDAYWEAVGRSMARQEGDAAGAAQAPRELPQAAPAAEPRPAGNVHPTAAPAPGAPVSPVITDIRAAAPPRPRPAPAAGPPLQQTADARALPAEAAPEPGFDLKGTVRRLEAALAAGAGSDVSARRLLSLLYLAAGDEVGALRDIPELSKEDREVWSQLMWLNANLWRVNEGLSPENRAAESLAALQELERTLRRAAGLRISAVKLCSRVDYYGAYEELPEAAFAPGKPREARVYIETENMLAERQADGRLHMKLRLRLQLFRTGQSQPVWQSTYGDVEDASQTLRRDFFMSPLVQWPAALAPGEHVLKVAVDDLLAGETDERSVPVQFE
jgi:hypothetical protein